MAIAGQTTLHFFTQATKTAHSVGCLRVMVKCHSTVVERNYSMTAADLLEIFPCKQSDAYIASLMVEATD